MPKANWYVYLLKCADGSLYCGVTVDLKRRIREHNAGTGARYTRSRRPVVLATATQVAGRSEALRLEATIKRLPRHRKLPHLAAVDATTLPKVTEPDTLPPDETGAPGNCEPMPD